MQQKLFALSFGFAILILAMDRAHAAAECGARQDVIQALETRFGETRRSVGLASGQALIETFASDTTHTWTIILSMANGTSCLLASGQAYVSFSPARGAAGHPV